MTIAIPLIALVVLLVVWAKCCPEIKEPIPRYVCRKIVPLDDFSWHGRGIAVDFTWDPDQWERMVKNLEPLATAMWRVGEASKKASLEFMHIDLMLHDD